MEHSALPEICIRSAQASDAGTIIESINSVCAEEIYLQTDRYIPNAQWESALHHPESVPDHLILVAESRNKIIGIINVFPGVNSKDNHTADLGIHVVAEYRNQGIGTRLMQNALDWSLARGYKKITLSAFATNARAIHLYKKFGFVHEGVRRQQFRVHGEYVDDVLMAKFF